MKLIPLTKGKFAMVDDEDFVEFSCFKWRAQPDRTRAFYVVRNVGRKSFLLHREIMSAPKGYVVDHINHDTLDNRRGNLRICTYSQNGFSRNSLNKDNTSGVRGVSFYKNRWVASAKYGGKLVYLGRFKNKEDAIRARKESDRKMMGEFA
jgi:hypothetical protein